MLVVVSMTTAGNYALHYAVGHHISPSPR